MNTHWTRPARVLLGMAVMTATLLGGVSAAWAGTGLGIVPSIPQNVTVGNTGVAASLSITNLSANSTGETGFDTDSFRLDDITLVPSCGSAAVSADCPVGSRDPGVIVPSPLTAVGRAGTACAGIAFTITNIDAAQGKYRFTPSSQVILGPSSGALAQRNCTIDFTVSVPRAPLIDSDPATAGLQTDQKAFALATDITQGVHLNLTASGIGTARTTVARATPAINTQASPTTTLGEGVLTDVATVTGLVNPVAGAGAGTVTFTLYGPGDTTCATPILTRASRPLTLNGAATGGTADSGGGFTPVTAGTYRWIASYSGDANNAAVAGTCTSNNEQTLVRPRPAIAIVKTVDPSVRAVPGGQFTFTVQVSNPGPEPILIQTLIDNVYGNIANASGARFTGSTCGVLIGTTLAAGASAAPCTFVGTFTSATPATETDVVTVTGVGTVSGVPVTANDNAVVRLVPQPRIAVVKDAAPGSQPVPGGPFTFTVRVSNPGPETIVILTLTDNVYGNIANASGARFTNSTCGALIGTTVGPGAQSAPCTFVGTFTSAAPATETDTVTVTGRGTESGLPVTANDNATVTLTPAPAGVAEVLPETGAPAGTARAIAPTGCVTRNFNVQVTGRQIRRVVFYLDAKKVKTLTRPNSGTRFALPVRPSSLRRGTHRVLAVTYFNNASGTKSRTLRVTFSRCARQAVAPRFTG